MAESKNNYVMFAMSGKLDKLLIFRQHGGKTIVTAVPNRSNTFTDEQLQIQSKFKEAASWARGILRNAENRKFYSSLATGGQSAFNMAIADWFTDPEIKEIDTLEYTGATGSIIKIGVADIIKVQAVRCPSQPQTAHYWKKAALFSMLITCNGYIRQFKTMQRLQAPLLKQRLPTNRATAIRSKR